MFGLDPDIFFARRSLGKEGEDSVGVVGGLVVDRMAVVFAHAGTGGSSGKARDLGSRVRAKDFVLACSNGKDRAFYFRKNVGRVKA